MIKQSLFELQSSYSILPLRPDDGQLGLCHSHLGAGDIFIALRFLCPLGGRVALQCQFHLTAICGLALCQNGQCADNRRFSLGLIGGIRRHGGAGTGDASLLLGLMQCGQVLALRNAVSGIG